MLEGPEIRAQPPEGSNRPCSPPSNASMRRIGDHNPHVMLGDSHVARSVLRFASPKLRVAPRAPAIALLFLLCEKTAVSKIAKTILMKF